MTFVRRDVMNPTLMTVNHSVNRKGFIADLFMIDGSTHAR